MWRIRPIERRLGGFAQRHRRRMRVDAHAYFAWKNCAETHEGPTLRLPKRCYHGEARVSCQVKEGGPGHAGSGSGALSAGLAIGSALALHKAWATLHPSTSTFRPTCRHLLHAHFSASTLDFRTPSCHICTASGYYSAPANFPFVVSGGQADQPW